MNNFGPTIRTKDDDDDEDDGRKPSIPASGLLLRYSDLPFVLVVVVVLGWGLRRRPKNKGIKRRGVSLVPPRKDEGRWGGSEDG
jgi:hypothetical protein